MKTIYFTYQYVTEEGALSFGSAVVPFENWQGQFSIEELAQIRSVIATKLEQPPRGGPENITFTFWQELRVAA